MGFLECSLEGLHPCTTKKIEDKFNPLKRTNISMIF
jgi:hypothetical protein